MIRKELNALFKGSIWEKNSMMWEKMDSVGMYRKKMLATGNNMQRH